MTSNAHIDAARIIVRLENGTQHTNEAIGRLDIALRSDDTLAFQIEAENLIIDLCNDLAELRTAVAKLIDPEALKLAQDELQDR